VRIVIDVLPNCSRSEKLSMTMDAKDFRAYLEQHYTSDFAKFVCQELSFLVPVAFVMIDTLDDLRTHITRCHDMISQECQSLYFYPDNRSPLEIRKPTLGLLEQLRQEIFELIARKRRQIGK
jgi:hypothetical protein